MADLSRIIALYLFCFGIAVKMGNEGTKTPQNGGHYIYTHTHTHNVRRHIIEDHNIQQQRCHNITYLKFRCLRSHSYIQMSCMWCYLLLTLNLFYISSLVSVSCATQPSAYHSILSYYKIMFSFGCLTHPQ
jgi:hypothetical protein